MEDVYLQNYLPANFFEETLISSLVIFTALTIMITIIMRIAKPCSMNPHGAFGPDTLVTQKLPGSQEKATKESSYSFFPKKNSRRGRALVPRIEYQKW